MLVGDGHDYLAERQAPVERAYPPLFRRGLLDGHRLGALQAAMRALDQQRAQVRVAAATDSRACPPLECCVGTGPSHAAMIRGCRP
jgi:hypothetical protein